VLVLRGPDERHQSEEVLGLLPGANPAWRDEEGTAGNLGREAMTDELLRLRTALYAHVQQGLMNVDVDAAYWTVDRALAGKADAAMAVRYAKETLATLEPPKRVELQARTISKAEHDALLDGPAPKSVSREEYERMMREAQE
jgi:hypothetical protein